MWVLGFRDDGLASMMNVVPTSSLLREIKEFDTIEVDMPNLPKNTKIKGGKIQIVANSVTLNFVIKEQNTTSMDTANTLSIGGGLKRPLTNSVTVVSQ